MTFKMNGSEFFNFTKCRTRIVPRLFFSLGFIWREKKLKFDLWFLHLPPFGLTCCNCNPTLSAHHHIFVAILCMYVWGQIISEVEILYFKALQIHVRLKTFEVESLFLWAFVLFHKCCCNCCSYYCSSVHRVAIMY